MASGILGNASLTASTDTTVYTVPSGKTASLTINFCNRSSSDPVKIRLSLTPNIAAANNYIEYDSNVPAAGVLERGAIVLAAGDKIITRSTSSSVTVVVYGVEE
jgi:hypothetical protein